MSEKDEHKLPTSFIEEHCKEATDLIISMTAYKHIRRPTAEGILNPGGLFESYTRKLKHT